DKEDKTASKDEWIKQYLDNKNNSDLENNFFESDEYKQMLIRNGCDKDPHWLSRPLSIEDSVAKHNYVEAFVTIPDKHMFSDVVQMALDTFHIWRKWKNGKEWQERSIKNDLRIFSHPHTLSTYPPGAVQDLGGLDILKGEMIAISQVLSLPGVFKTPMFISYRDMVTCVFVYSFPNGEFLIGSCSIDHPQESSNQHSNSSNSNNNNNNNNTRVRAWIYNAIWHLAPLPNDSSKCHIAYYVHMTLGGSLPNWLVNQAAVDIPTTVTKLLHFIQQHATTRLYLPSLCYVAPFYLEMMGLRIPYNLFFFSFPSVLFSPLKKKKKNTYTFWIKPLVLFCYPKKKKKLRQVLEDTDSNTKTNTSNHGGSDECKENGNKDGKTPVAINSNNSNSSISLNQNDSYHPNTTTKEIQSLSILKVTRDGRALCILFSVDTAKKTKQNILDLVKWTDIVCSVTEPKEKSNCKKVRNSPIQKSLSGGNSMEANESKGEAHTTESEEKMGITRSSNDSHLPSSSSSSLSSSSLSSSLLLLASQSQLHPSDNWNGGHTNDAKTRAVSLLSLKEKASYLTVANVAISDLLRLTEPNSKKYWIRSDSESQSKDLFVYRFFHNQNDYNHYMGKALLKFQPKDIFHTLIEPFFRFIYDRMIQSIEILDKLDENTYIARFIYTSNQCYMKVSRQSIVVIKHKEIIPDEHYALAGVSVQHPAFPLSQDSSLPHMDVLASGWVIEKHPQMPLHSIVSYITNTCVGGKVPSNVAKIIAKKQTLAVLYVEKAMKEMKEKRDSK
ncbi:hypothetical protein RFI_27158, partial [Reticulomyxa filosa]